MPTTALVAQVATTLERHRLTRPGERVVVAVSGGPDSMALLDALVELREQLCVSLVVAHLNHGLRGAASDGDAQFVADRAAALGLPCRIGTADVAAERRQRGGSLEMAARRARYAFLQIVAAEAKAEKVALGHTSDDQVETILLRLLRGGELDALRGMPIARPISPGASTTVIRPLLEVSRAQVLEHLAARGATWRTDASNVDPSFTRNWIRHELLPALGADLPGLLLRAAERGGRLAEVIARQAGELVTAGEGEARLDVARLASLPRLIRRAALRRASQLVRKGDGLSWRTLDAMERLLEQPNGHAVSLPGGVEAQNSYGQLIVRAGKAPPPGFSVTLTVPGHLEVPQAGLWLDASEIACRLGAETSRWEETADLDVVGERLTVRTRRPGDRFVPLGLGAPTKLKDFLIAQRVPRAERGHLLLVEGKCGIVWVVGLRLDDRAKITPATRRCARLRAGPLPGKSGQ